MKENKKCIIYCKDCKDIAGQYIDYSTNPSHRYFKLFKSKEDADIMLNVWKNDLKGCNLDIKEIDILIQ